MMEIKRMRLMIVVGLLCLAFGQVHAYRTMILENTWIEQGVTQNGVKGIKVHCQVYLADYKDQEMKVVAYFYKAKGEMLPDLNGKYRTITGKVSTSQKLKPKSVDGESFNVEMFIPTEELHLGSGKHICYCRVHVIDPDSERVKSDYIAFEVVGAENDAKHLEVVDTWIEHGVEHNGVKGIKVHAKLKVYGYTGQDVEYVIGLYDENKNSYVNPIANYKLNAKYERSVWDDYRVFIALDDMRFKEGEHTYYCIVNVLAGDGARGVGEFVSFKGTGVAQNQPQHNHNHNHDHNQADNNSGKLQQAPVYHGKREGQYYYISETYQLGSFNFYYLNGDYLADAPGLYNMYGAITRYVLTDETADYYIFTQAKVLFNGGYEYLGYAPKMKISKGWNQLIIEKGSLLDRSDLVYVKEVSKEEYDEISRMKAEYLNSIGITSGGCNSSVGSSVDMSPNNSHIDKKCGYCGGGGGCSSCNGTGVKYNPWGGGYDTCPSCNGSGRCFNCRGTGVQATY